jgi:hypothetical protein
MANYVVSSSGKPMVWRSGNGAWIDVQANGRVLQLQLDVVVDISPEVLGVVQSAGYTATPS